MKMLCEFIPSSLKENSEWLSAYLQGLSAPMDSYAEDNLDKCNIFSIIAGGTHVGFIGVQGQTLWFFYVSAHYVRYAQDIFEESQGMVLRARSKTFSGMLVRQHPVAKEPRERRISHSC
ncbi:MAG: hypothetical protein Q8S19_03005 [Bacillota bacterium]|nr:hypothetical protein [Bacillota bacterium]